MKTCVSRVPNKKEKEKQDDHTLDIIMIDQSTIDKLCGVRRRPRFVRIGTALGGQVPYF